MLTRSSQSVRLEVIDGGRDRPRSARPAAAVRAVDWQDLRVFLEMAGTGGLGRAARRLRVSSATVARRVASLEADLGVALFARRIHGYVLTGAGRELARRLADLPGAIEAACAALHEAPPVWSFRCCDGRRLTAGGCSAWTTPLPDSWSGPDGPG